MSALKGSLVSAALIENGSMNPGFPLRLAAVSVSGWGSPPLKGALCCVAPWSLEGHAVSPLPCETGHACSLIHFFILLVIAGITNDDEQNVSLLFPSFNLKHVLTAPLCLIILPASFRLPGHFKKQCTVKSLPQMRSNTYRALPTTLFITINVSSPLHPSHTVITLVEMSNAFGTVVTRWWPGRYATTTFFLLAALCCAA